jgi:hypothetical protein
LILLTPLVVDKRWFGVYVDGNVQFSSGKHAWDLVTTDDQAIATGLYLYTVEDLQMGEIQKGKLTVIKSFVVMPSSVQTRNSIRNKWLFQS